MPGDIGQSLDVLRSAHADVLTLFNFWLDSRQGELLPRKSRIDPLDIPELLPSVWMYEYRPAADDFYCCIAGAEIDQAWGTTMRGVAFRDVVGKEDHPIALGRWKAVLTVPQIQYGRLLDRSGDTEVAIAERLVMPLESDAGDRSFTIGLSIYPFRQDDRKRTPPVWGDVELFPCRDLAGVDRL